MTTSVMSDAQMSMMQVVRPIPNFETVYQGQAGTIPIAFPGVLDPEAGQEGFSANLLAGIPVPLAARVAIYIPMVVDHYTSMPDYNYQIIWRIRNQQAYLDAIAANREGAPFHLPSEELGRKELQITDSPRFFIPAASDVEIFEQTEPGTNVPAVLNVRQQVYVPKLTNSWVQPLTATGSAAEWQQGAYQFSSNVNCSGPTWFPIWLDVVGDEMLILVYKNDTGVNWDFSGVDKGFSNTYGTNNGGLPNNPNIGILVSTGTMGGG